MSDFVSNLLGSMLRFIGVLVVAIVTAVIAVVVLFATIMWKISNHIIYIGVFWVIGILTTNKVMLEFKSVSSNAVTIYLVIASIILAVLYFKIWGDGRLACLGGAYRKTFWVVKVSFAVATVFLSVFMLYEAWRSDYQTIWTSIDTIVSNIFSVFICALLPLGILRYQESGENSLSEAEVVSLEEFERSHVSNIAERDRINRELTQ